MDASLFLEDARKGRDKLRVVRSGETFILISLQPAFGLLCHAAFQCDSIGLVSIIGIYPSIKKMYAAGYG